ncbi:MAG: hypothetical protein BMS9Abin36_0471 [Gammaproteobacteria bacterium]|nr:MAG: hypothetical protein BMS9Abin36_0471 [Gammaproteobacteria bacterium]
MSQARLSERLDQLASRPLPVMGSSARAMQALAQDGDIPISAYDNLVLKDPSLATNLIRLANGGQRSFLRSNVATVEQAAIMLGLSKVQGLPGRLPVIEKSVRPEGRLGFLRVMSGAYHAAFQAWNWATFRKDMAPEEVFVAAMLHNAGDMMLWAHVPDKMLRIEKMLCERRMPQDEVEYVVLGCGVDQVARHLSLAWHLPELVQNSLRPENALLPRALGIMLANKLARAAERGWHHGEMDNVLKSVADYLDIEEDEVTQQVYGIAIKSAHEARFPGVMSAAAKLVMIPVEEEEPEEEEQVSKACLIPRTDVLNNALRLIKNPKERFLLHDLMRIVMHGLHEGVGLNRSVFALLDSERSMLKARFMVGTDNDPEFNRFQLDLNGRHLFSRLLEKPQSIWINDSNRSKMWPLVPKGFRKLIGVDSFLAMSVFVRNRPVGLIYADRHVTGCDLDQRSYEQFKMVCRETSVAMTRLANSKG